MLLPEAPGHSQASLGQSLVVSLLLSPGSWCVQSSVCALQESVSQSCVSSGSSMVGLMTTSSKRAYATPRFAAPRAPTPLLTRTSAGDTQTLKGRSGSVSVGSPGAHKVLFQPSQHLWWVSGLISNGSSPPPTISLGLLPCPWTGIYFFGGIQHSPVTGHLAGSCNLGCHYVSFFSFFF